MKYLFLIFLPVFVLAKIHYARVEPYESVTMKSAVSAAVKEVALDDEGRMVKDAEIIHLDDAIDRVDLNTSRESLKLLEGILEINEEMVVSLEDSLKRQRGYYERMSKLSTASVTQKDNAFKQFVAAKNQYLSTKEKIDTLRKQILDMKYKISRLEDIISKKSIILKNRYLYKIAVRAGDFVNPGSPLAVVADLSRGKLTIYLEPSELDGVKKKIVYIDSKKTGYHVDKVWDMADEKFISSYRAEIYIDRPEGYFSKLVKVELK